MLKEYIDKLECIKIERGDQSIQKALDSFNCGDLNDPRSKVSQGMVSRFKDYISEDSSQFKAHDVYYIIKEKGCDEIILFFSLQASQIFSTGGIFPEDTIYLKQVYNIADTDASGYDAPPAPDVFAAQLESYPDLIEEFPHLKAYLSKTQEEIAKLLVSLSRRKECKAKDEQKSVYVDLIIPSIEMVNFCKNYNADLKWHSISSSNLGAAMFWLMILPIIEEISGKIGCTYVSLFAADVSEENSDKMHILLSYYESALSFEKKDDLCVLKPYYDWECVFLCQEIKVLSKRKDAFIAAYLSETSEDDV